MFNHLIASGEAPRRLWNARTAAASVAFHGAVLVAVSYASVAVHEEITRLDDKVVLMDIDAFIPPAREERLPTTRTVPPADAERGPRIVRRAPAPAAETEAPPSPPSEIPALDDLLAAASTGIPGGAELDGMLGLSLAEKATVPPVIALGETEEFLEYESFASFVIAPQIRNTGEMRTFLRRHYQPILEFTGATGVVQLHFWIDEKGGVARAEIASSSGSRSLDRLAIRVSRILRFAPAMRLGRPVRVLVRLPITFREVVTN